MTTDPATPLRASLATRHCVPCEGGAEPLTRSEADGLLAQVEGWKLIDGEPLKIARSMKLKDFWDSMTFVNKVAELAEEEAHHPDICISWNRVTLELFTHAIGGLSENEFIMAAKINRLASGG